MKDIKCMVCNGKHFRKGYYEVNVDVDIYSKAYNNAHISTNDFELRNKLSVNVSTEIMNETYGSGDLEFYLNKKINEFRDNYINLHTYSCENCGYIMSFTKEINVESKEEERERKKKENMYDWTDFGRNSEEL